MKEQRGRGIMEGRADFQGDGVNSLLVFLILRCPWGPLGEEDHILGGMRHMSPPEKILNNSLRKSLGLNKNKQIYISKSK